MCVCACRKSGTLSWRVWTKICRQQMCSCLEERRPTVWAQKLYSPMEEVEGKFANQAWMWCTSKNQFRASAGLRWCVLFLNWPTWEDHVGFFVPWKPEMCLFIVLCCIWRSVTLSQYLGQGQNLLLVLLRHFGWLLWRDHVTELKANQVSVPLFLFH